jgi:4-diphosphocytidyl-2-C-methyl-D-erythritol kinase
MATRVRSYSKINLGLAIGPVRADGFHGLVTLYQTLGLHDWVTVEVKPGSRFEVRGLRKDGERIPGAKARIGSAPVMPGLKSRPISETITPSETISPSGTVTPSARITLTSNDARVPADARNTAWKMVELALARMGVAAEVAIHIEKQLPVQGGMGAGSANAAAALMGLERELGWALPEAERLELAAEVGSDVPLFLVGGAVLGVGRGEVVSAMADLPATWCVVAVPEVGVSTPRAFQEWDSLCQEAGSRDQGTAEEGPGLKPPKFGPGYRGLKPAATPGDRAAEGARAAGGFQPPPAAGLTSPPRPDRLKQLSHVYASVFGARASDTSGIVRGLNPEIKQGGSEDEIPNIGAPDSEQGSTLNGLAGNTLLALVRTGIENDFETVVFPQYPLLREIKHELMGSSAGESGKDSSAGPGGNALYAALSGSGSALFGLYGSERDAREAQRRVQAAGCKAILTETLPRQQYWRTMFAE